MCGGSLPGFGFVYGYLITPLFIMFVTVIEYVLPDRMLQP
jgi:hypothetical protein